MEPDRGLEVLPVVVTARGHPDLLDRRVQALRSGVAHSVSEVRPSARPLVAGQGVCRIDHRLQALVGCPEVPALPVLLAPTPALMGPEVARALLDRPCPGGQQVSAHVGWRRAPTSRSTTKRTSVRSATRSTTRGADYSTGRARHSTMIVLSLQRPVELAISGKSSRDRSSPLNTAERHPALDKGCTIIPYVVVCIVTAILLQLP